MPSGKPSNRPKCPESSGLSGCLADVSPGLREFIEAVVIPALVDRLVRERPAGVDGRMAVPDAAESSDLQSGIGVR